MGVQPYHLKNNENTIPPNPLTKAEEQNLNIPESLFLFSKILCLRPDGAENAVIPGQTPEAENSQNDGFPAMQGQQKVF